MADRTGIPYATSTWNVVDGCTEAGQGCDNCWARNLIHTRMSVNPMTHDRFSGLTEHVNGRVYWTGEIRTRPELLEQPVRWRKPRVVFICSMSDLFHSAVPFDFIDAVFRTICACKGRHTFLLLTKRPARMVEYSEHARRTHPGWFTAKGDWDLWGLYWGVSAWNRPSLAAARRHLLRIPGRRWLSMEPVLDYIDLDTITCGRCGGEFTRATSKKALTRVCPYCEHSDEFAGPRHTTHIGGALKGIELLVLGAESGADRRSHCDSWLAREARDACLAAGAKFYLKQMNVPKTDGRVVKQVLVHQPSLDGRQWLETPWDIGESR